jgi:hypothetical protein
MPASIGHPFLRSGRLNAYAAYRIGCAVAWAVLWTNAATTATKQTLGYILVAFIGLVMGWTSATVARVVYPPAQQRHSAGATSLFKGFRERSAP